MADAVELLIPFTNIADIFHQEKVKARDWWCWGAEYVVDILEIIMFMEKKGLHVDTGMFQRRRRVWSQCNAPHPEDMESLLLSLTVEMSFSVEKNDFTDIILSSLFYPLFIFYNRNPI
jgi:hypothetical protein